MIRLLSVDDIEIIHIQIIDASGGSQGVRDRGRLASVVAAQTQEVFGEQIYKTLHDKAAAIARGVIADHPFFDGNKRTGIMSALIFLKLNNVDIGIDGLSLANFAVLTATDKLSVTDIAIWLKNNTKKGDE